MPTNKHALKEVLNVTLIKEVSGDEVVDENLDDGEEGTTSPKPPPSATTRVRNPHKVDDGEFLIHPVRFTE